MYLHKAIGELKSDGEITICPPFADWAESKMEVGAHCDDGGILIKGGRKGKIGIIGFIREKSNVDIEIRVA